MVFQKKLCVFASLCSNQKQQRTMEKETNNNIWSKILKITITVLTALATALGLQACGIL